jgi:A/G-specific adenine glycosylase
MSKTDPAHLYAPLKRWFTQNQRDLPWRHDRSGYRVWLSEIMLQQTQVVTVIGYFNRFMEAFPTVEALANAPEDQVLALWSGLGYYSRCRNLHKSAKIVASHHQGNFPERYEDLLTLPGVGSYTAGAICAFAYNKPAPVVDGNVARVLSRLFNDDTELTTPKGKKHFEATSLDLALKAQSPQIWQEGLMELGATICKPKSPDCPRCPLESSCVAHKIGRVDELPKKAQKRARQALHVVCALIQDNHHVWLEKNEQARLFKGLYAPPNVVISNPSEQQNALRQLLIDRQISDVPKATKPIIVKRTLTHRDLTLYGFLIPGSPKSLASNHWIAKSELHSVGISTAIRELLRFETNLL